MRTINYQTGQESILSRIPGLFAYTEINEKGASVLHKATDSPMGCYGKIVENIQIPLYVNIYDKDGMQILNGGEIYTYKTLMYYYYKYNDNNEIEGYDTLASFIDEGIGKIKVEYEGYNPKKNDLVPEFVYLTMVEDMYNEMVKLEAKCNFYKTRTSIKEGLPDYDEDEKTCCDCQMYERKGGDGMLRFLFNNRHKAIEIAEKYYNYVPRDYNSANEYQRLTLNYPINLFSTVKDLGIVTPTLLDDNVWNRKLTQDIELKGQDDSKLKSLRISKNYINEEMESASPQEGFDWLYYYRVGYVRNQSVLYDELSNIQLMDEQLPEEGAYSYNLWAFGDVIESIIRDKVNRTITFTYWTDVHLIAKCTEIKHNDDGKALYCFDEFKPHYNFIDYSDSEYIKNYPEEIPNYHGIKYIESYYYNNDSEIANLSDIEFFDYVHGYCDLDELRVNSVTEGEESTGEDNDIESKIQNAKVIEKYEFITSGSRINYPMEIGDKIVNISVNSTDFYTKVIRHIESIDDYNPFARHEYYNGISYPSSEQINVYIDRGTSTVFDRCIRMSEVKTLNDMEEYSNGGYFNML